MSEPCAIIRIYRKGGSMSFLENENQMVVDVEIREIIEQLFEEWHNSNLDEGTFYADWRIASMSSSNYLKGRFNQFYDLNPGDEYYIEVE